MRTGSRRHRISTVFQIPGRRADTLRIGRYTNFLDTTRLVARHPQEEAQVLRPLEAADHRRARLPRRRQRGRGPAVPADIDALRAALDDHHHQRGDQRLGQGVRGRRGGERDRGQGVPPLPPGQDNRQVLQAEGPAEGRARQAVTGIGEKTLAQPVKPPLRERRACLAKLVKNRLTLTPGKPEPADEPLQGGVRAAVAALGDEPVVNPPGGVALLPRAPRSASRTPMTHSSLPSSAGLPLLWGIGAAGDMSSKSAYFATVFRLTWSTRAISDLQRPAASIDRISFTVSRGTVISSILPGRARQSNRPGKPYGEGRAPGPRGAALLLKLLNFSCSRCLFPSDHSDHFLVNINSRNGCTDSPSARECPRD